MEDVDNGQSFIRQVNVMNVQLAMFQVFFSCLFVFVLFCFCLFVFILFVCLFFVCLFVGLFVCLFCRICLQVKMMFLTLLRILSPNAAGQMHKNLK